MTVAMCGGGIGVTPQNPVPNRHYETLNLFTSVLPCGNYPVQRHEAIHRWALSR